ncbi:hypothetical protein [Corynebacterium kalidii]
MNNTNNPVSGYRARELAASTHVEVRFDAKAWIASHRPRYGKAILVRRIHVAAAKNGLVDTILGRTAQYGKYSVLDAPVGLSTAAGEWS